MVDEEGAGWWRRKTGRLGGVRMSGDGGWAGRNARAEPQFEEVGVRRLEVDGEGSRNKGGLAGVDECGAGGRGAEARGGVRGQERGLAEAVAKEYAMQEAVGESRGDDVDGRTADGEESGGSEVGQDGGEERGSSTAGEERAR